MLPPLLLVPPAGTPATHAAADALLGPPPQDAFAKHAAAFEAAGVDLKNGLGDVYDKISDPAIIADVEACYTTRPPLAFVDSRKGITNLHVPSDVIIDASMPVSDAPDYLRTPAVIPYSSCCGSSLSKSLLFIFT